MSLRQVPGPRRGRGPVCQPVAPYFLLPPRNAAVHPGDTATFYVKSHGYPEPSVTFAHEGEPLAQDPRFCLRRLGQGIHVLSVGAAGSSTAGRYTCQLANCTGKAQSSFRLELKDPVGQFAQCSLRRYHSWGESHPRFVTKPCNATVQEGGSVEFKARVTGRPPPSVRWLKDSVVLPSTSVAHSSFSAGFHRLELCKVHKEDQGLYTCQLSSLAGETSASAQLTVTGACPSVSPTHSCARTQKCRGSGHHPQEDVEPWCRMYLKSSAASQDSPAGETALGNGPTTKSSALESRMRPAQSATEDERGQVAELEPPRFTRPLEDISVDEGCEIVLHGLITGSHPVRVTWLHNGEAVRFGKPSFDGGAARLVVQECLPEDAGAYTCVAENRAGKTSSSSAVCVRDFETICGIRNAKLSSAPLSNCILERKTSRPLNTSQNNRIQSVPVAPDIRPAENPGHRKGISPKRRASSGSGPPVQLDDPPKRLEVWAGQTARLQCKFLSSFPVASGWIRNKKQVVDGPRIRVESSDRGSVLVISEVRHDDTGSYTIVARDRRGSTRHSVNLTVIDRPQPPASCPVISHLSTSSLVLSWSGPCYDGGSAVQRYVVEVRREGPGKPGDWREVTAHCRSTSYRLRSGLEPQAEYSFRVRACNAVGVSEPSQESEIVKMDTSAEPQEEPQAFVDVTVDTVHKVAEHYDVKEKLGVGKFGQVFRLVHKETGRVCAGKFYKGRRTKEREAARKEIELMGYLHHPKLVQCLGAYDNRSEFVMVMEFVAGGELFERIVDDNFEHTEPNSVRYVQQILAGIQYMHRQSIVHLDLKPENIVCVNSTGTLIKIIDFGLANKLDPNVPLKVMHGTPEFVAPEVISFEPVGLATDMWSIGVICYILLSGESPFQGSSDAETLSLVTAGEWAFDEDSFQDITDLAKDFISCLLRKDVRHRMCCDEALAHAWMEAPILADPRTTKSLSKEKMRKFLASRKWKKTGKALLALKRMALLSNKADEPGDPSSPADSSPSLSPETEQVLQSLGEKLLSKPWFSQALADLTPQPGSTARLSCHIQGYPDPEVVWLQDEKLLAESDRVLIEYQEDGRCTLVLTQVRPEDSGLYTCKATNSQGEALCSARLTVKS